MLVAAVIGFIFPQHVATLGKWVPYLLGIVMLGMGLTITPNDFKMVFKAPRAVIIGVCLQFSIMPTLAFIIAKSFQFTTRYCCWRNISWMLSGWDIK